MELYLCEHITKKEDAYTLLAYAVRQHWGLSQLPPIARTEGGKPYFPTHPQYHFNLSHSGCFALCVLDDQPVGADIEVIRPHHPNLAQRICSREELDWLNAQSDLTIALCQLWTAKEALVKYHGIGLTVPLRSIRVPLPPVSKQDHLHFHSMVTQTRCVCICGHSAAAPLVIVPPEEISL